MKWRRWMPLLLALVLLVSMLPTTVFASDTTAFANAIQVEMDQTYSAVLTIQPRSDYHYAKFSLESYGILTLVYERPEGPDGKPLLINPRIGFDDGERFDSFHGMGGEAFSAEHDYAMVALAPGDYCIEFELYYHYYYGLSGTYEFEYALSFTPTDMFEVEPNHEINDATYLPLSVPMYGFSNGRPDYWFCYSPIAFEGRLYITGIEPHSGYHSGIEYQTASMANMDGFVTSQLKKDADGNSYYPISCDAGYTVILVTEIQPSPGTYFEPYSIEMRTPTPLTITQQPKSVTAYEGETVNVTVKASGKNLKYQWYYCNAGSDEFVMSGTKSNIYTVAMNESRNGRYLTCVITDAYGVAVQTDIVSIHMAPPMSIVKQPANMEGAFGEAVSTSVEAVGKNLSYQWFVSPVGDKNFYKSSITTNTYTTTMDIARHGRRVYCLITDGNGKTLKTNTVTMQLTGTTPVRIDTQPVNVLVEEGENAVIRVAASGDGLTYKWYIKNKGGAGFAYSSTFTGNSYSAQMNETRDGRQVYCVITDIYGNSVKTDTVTMSMKAKEPKPLVITKQPASVAVPEGKNAVVSFAATGDGLTYRWYYKNAGAADFAYTATFSGNTYTAQMNDVRNGRQIYCVVTDQYGNSIQTDTVTISQSVSGVRITTQPVSVAVEDGLTAQIRFTAVGEGLVYKWYIKNKGSTSFAYSSTFTGSVYSAQMNEARDGRQLYCIVTDIYGNSVKTNTVTMSIARRLSITEQPVNASAPEGKNAVVRFSAVGDGLTYQWYYKNAGDKEFSYTATFKTNTYSAPMNEARHGRQVYCVVTDKYGNSVQTNTVTITMAQGVRIKKQPVSVSADKGETAVVGVVASGEGLTYKWYLKKKGAADFLYSATFTGNTYSAIMSEARDGRQLYCIVTDKFGNSVKSNVVTLSMNKASGTTGASGNVIAGGEWNGGPVTWTVTTDGTLTISGNSYVIYIQGSQEYIWQKYADKVTKIVIEDGLTKIPESAFRDMVNVTEVYIGSDVKTIGEEAFWSCTRLKKITFGENCKLQQIGEAAFAHTDLRKFTAPASLQTIETRAFAECTNLEYVCLRGGVSSVRGDAFENCTGLKTLILGESLTDLDNGIFTGCYEITTLENYASGIGVFRNMPKLTTLVIGGERTTSGDYSNCPMLTNVTILSDISKVTAYAFSGCTSLSTLKLPETVTEIGAGAFRNAGITHITIPSGVTEMGIAVFTDSALQEIVFTGNVPKITNDLGFTNVTATAYYPANNPTWTEEARKDYGGSLTWVAQ